MKKRTIWTEQLVFQELVKSVEILGLKRMPTAEELKSIGRNDLHCKISKTKKYSGWAEELGLKMKNSETVIGQKYEEKVAKVLIALGYGVEITSTKHPYDLLVDGSLKVDVKVANAYLLRGMSRVHTVRLAKTEPTCDIYICALLDEVGIVERLLIIPSHHVRKTMLNIGRRSKYNTYDKRFDYIESYIKFFESVI